MTFKIGLKWSVTTTTNILPRGVWIESPLMSIATVEKDVVSKKTEIGV